MASEMPTLQVSLRRQPTAVIVATIFALCTVRMTEARPIAYVTNAGDGTVAVVDVGTNAHRETIRLCEFTEFCNLGGIAIAPGGRRAYVLSRETLFVARVSEMRGERRAATLSGFQRTGCAKA